MFWLHHINTSPDYLGKRQTNRSPVEGGSNKHKALLQSHLGVMLCNTCPLPRKGSQVKRGRCHTHSAGMGPGTLAKEP